VQACRPAHVIAWRLATVVNVLTETPRTRTLVLDVPGWPSHRAGQHVDVRLTAEDGYQTQRSYSIASAPQDARVALTVDRLDDGEVSPYLTDVLSPGDRLELRGPKGDILALPSWALHEHANLSARDDAVLFSIQDRPVLEALGLYREETLRRTVATR
jgi:ferredoxin-NADP reductase